MFKEDTEIKGTEERVKITILPATEAEVSDVYGLISAIVKRAKGNAGVVVSRMLHAGYTSEEIIAVIKKYFSINQVCTALVQIAMEVKG